MMRRIVNSSLRFRVLVIAAAGGLMFVGVTQVRKTPVDVYPQFTPTVVEVQTEALGLSAAEVEQLITVPLEADLLNGVAWLDDIRSESVPGLSSITLVFEPGTSLYRARQMVQERLAQAHAIPNVSKPPQMLQPVSSTSRTMMIGLSSKTLSLIEVSQLARWTIKPRLMGVEGVANVSTYGHRERQLQVQIDPKQLGEEGVSLQQVVETTGNALWVSPLSFLEASTPGTGGFLETPNQRIGVQHVQPIESADDLAQVPIAPKEGTDGAILRLGDVAEVVEDHQPLIGDAQVDGDSGLLLVIERLPDANTVDVTKGVEAALADLRPGLDGLKIDTSIYQPAEYIHTATGNVGRAAVAALALVVVLLAFAFYHWRTAILSIVTILTSLAAAGAVLYLRGTTVNSMVLAGLAVALGAVIDDAISGSERLARRLREAGSEDSVSTIAEAAVEVRSSMAYATLFILLPVVPVFFMGDLFGAFGRPLATSYVLAVAASMVTALTLTPALGLVLLGRTPLPARESPLFSRVGARYDGLLSRLLMSRKSAFALAAVLVIIGLVALPTMRRSELPALQERDFVVELEAKPGTSLAKMNELTAQATADLAAIPGVRNVASHTGRAVTGDKVADVNSSELWVSIDQQADYATAVAAVRKTMAKYRGYDRDVHTYMQARVKEAKSGADDPVVVRVYGQRADVLADKAKEVRDELAKIDGIANLNVELPVNEPALEVQVDLERAKEFGIKPGDVRRQAATLLSGIEVGQLFYDQKIFEVVVWGAPETRRNVDDVRNLLLDTDRGQVRMSEVADVQLVNSPDVIEREGAFRRIDVTAKVSGRDEAAVLSDVQKTIEAIDFPLEYRAEVIGEYQAKKAAETRLLWLGALAAVGMLLLLQAGFGRWLLGALYFLTLPIALTGGVVAALVAGGAVSIGATVGLLTVLGIAARNGILLIRRYQQLERREGVPFGLNLVVRGARERLAPTLMTAMATALAFAPFVVLGSGPGFEILHPMGIVVLGGLVTATLVNVFIVPALYLNFGNVESDTEVDLRLFEEELSPTPPVTVTVPANGASVPLAGAGAEA